MLGGLDLGENVLIAGAKKRDTRVELARVVHIGGQGDDVSVLFDTADGQDVYFAVATAPNIVFACRKRLAVDNKIVGDVDDEAIWLSVSGRGQNCRAKRHH